jgi:hypothetical protein
MVATAFSRALGSGMSAIAWQRIARRGARGGQRDAEAREADSEDVPIMRIVIS